MTNWNYCPECAKGLIIQSDAGGETHPSCPDGHFVYYDNPKPCAGALVEKDGKYLLLKRANPPKAGTWNLPGGFMEAGETVEEAIKRELKEETGLEVEPYEYFMSRPSKYGGEGDELIGMSFKCHVIGGEFSLAPESTEAGWFTPTEMPLPEMPDDRAVVETLKRQFA